MKRLAHWLALLALLCCGGAMAQTCTVSAAGAAFSIYTPTAALPNDTVASVTVTCSAVIAIGVSYGISLSSGNGTYANRKMLNENSSPMTYQIYTDLTRSKIWGDGSGGSFAVSDGYPLGIIVPVVKTYTGYARIPALQNAQAGSYADNLVVTISY